MAHRLHWNEGAAMQMNWLSSGGDVHLKKDNKILKGTIFETKLNALKANLRLKDNQYIYKTDKIKEKRTALLGMLVGKNVGDEVDIRIPDKLDVNPFNNFIGVISIETDEIKNNLNDFACALASVGIRLYIDGKLKKTGTNTAEMVIDNFYYLMIDEFDFKDDKSLSDGSGNWLVSQPLGTWEHDIFSPTPPVSKALMPNSLDNYDYREFKRKTGLGKDFKIYTEYINMNEKFFNKIKFNDLGNLNNFTIE